MTRGASGVDDAQVRVIYGGVASVVVNPFLVAMMVRYIFGVPLFGAREEFC